MAAFIVIVGIEEEDDDGDMRVRMRKLKIFCIQNFIMNSAARPVGYMCGYPFRHPYKRTRAHEQIRRRKQ